MNPANKKIMLRFRQFLNYSLDKIIEPQKQLNGKIWNTYLIWQYFGFAAGTFIIFSITLLIGLSLQIVTAEIIIAVFTSVVIFKSTEWINRKSNFLIWLRKGVYHYQVLCIVFVSLFLYATEQPVLLYLDTLAVGFAAAQVCGRIGCLKVGCCYGRPNNWGVRYGLKHLESGYGHYLLGARLLPVQLFEAVWLFIITIAGIAMIIDWNMPGAALSWYILAYSLGRFILEFLRADTDRLFLYGFSEAQWTALFLITIVIILDFFSILPFYIWHLIIGAVPPLIIAVAAIIRRFSSISDYPYTNPYHLRELSGIINWLTELETGIGNISNMPLENLFAETSLGIQVSLTTNDNADGFIYRYSFFSPGKYLSPGVLTSLAKFVALYRHPDDSYKISFSDKGICNISVLAAGNKIDKSEFDIY